MSQKRELNLTINGKAYLVEVNDFHASPLLVRVNGREYQVTINNQQSAVNSQQATTNDQRPTASAHSQFTIQNSQSAIGNVITAPMPGNIIRIAVKPGDQVSVGQTLCYLEAMKMQNAIRSPRDGVIASVDVGEGTAVSHGDTIITFTD